MGGAVVGLTGDGELLADPCVLDGIQRLLALIGELADLDINRAVVMIPMDEQTAVLIPDLAYLAVLEHGIGAGHHVIEVPVRGQAVARAAPATDGAAREEAIASEGINEGGLVGLIAIEEGRQAFKLHGQIALHHLHGALEDLRIGICGTHLDFREIFGVHEAQDGNLLAAVAVIEALGEDDSLFRCLLHFHSSFLSGFPPAIDGVDTIIMASARAARVPRLGVEVEPG